MKTIFLLTGVSLITFVGSIKDYDGNNYETIKIGSQKWSNTTLSVTHFNNGDPIVIAKSIDEWDSLGKESIPACAYNDFNPLNSKDVVYNWYVVNDSRGICPKGWRIPSMKDFEKMIIALGGFEVAVGGFEVAGKKMKSSSGWEYMQGNNEAGLNIQPKASLQGKVFSGSNVTGFVYLGEYSYLWTRDAVGPISDSNLKSFGYFLQINGYDDKVGFYSNPNNFQGNYIYIVK